MVRVSVSTPYRANSIIRVAQAAGACGCLHFFYTSIYLARSARAAARLPGFGARLRSEVNRRAFSGIDEARVIGLPSALSFGLVAARRGLAGVVPVVPAYLQGLQKARFDADVAARIGREAPDAVIGMYGSCLRTFEAAKRAGALSVLNFINSHPRDHNRYLMEFAGLKKSHHEILPDPVIERVEGELDASDLIIVPSEFVAKQLRVRGYPESKIRLIPYGVDLSSFYPPSVEFNAKGCLECLYVGQMSHRKGVSILVEAARRCKGLPLRFRLIGPIVSREVLHDLPPNVRYEGAALPGTGVAGAMRTANIFAIPTLDDAFALVVFEAMAAGLPVVTTWNAGATEWLEGGDECLVVPPGNVEALVESLRLLATDADVRYKIAAAGRRKVRNTYSWERFGNLVLRAVKAQLSTV
jgi:glycosyltransferase involved in cell wall biosynthesis